MADEQGTPQLDTRSILSAAMNASDDNQSAITDPVSQEASPAEQTPQETQQTEDTSQSAEQNAPQATEQPNTQTPTPEENQVTPSPEESSGNPLVDLLSQNGFENITSENAQSRLAEALGEMNSLRGQADQVSQIQQSMNEMQQRIEAERQPANQQQSQDDAGHDAFTVPSFRQDWNHHLDSETGQVKDTAPADVKDAFRQVSEARQKSVSDPVGWFMDNLQAASSDPRFSDILAPAVQPVIENQFGQREVQNEANRQYSELSDAIFQKDPLTQKLRTESGQPVYNEKGGQVYQAAIEELSYYRQVHPSQVANMVSEQELIGAMHRQLKREAPTTQQAAPVVPATQNTETVEQQRQQNRDELVKQNSFATTQDPGGDRGNNAFSNGQGTAHLESSGSPQAIANKGSRALLQAAMQAQVNGQSQ
tara:strand:- start:6086 stop:7354 length:1269 start_codon:yes stop_codon:yes gene_type:complete